MQTNNHKIVDYDAVLDAKFGEAGTPSRIKSFCFLYRSNYRTGEERSEDDANATCREIRKY
jgi:hypothetical protein